MPTKVEASPKIRKILNGLEMTYKKEYSLKRKFEFCPENIQ